MKDKIFMILLGIIAVNLTYLSLNLKDLDFSQSQDDEDIKPLSQLVEEGRSTFTFEEVMGLPPVSTEVAVNRSITASENKILEALQSHHVQITGQIEIATNNIQSDIAFFGR